MTQQHPQNPVQTPNLSPPAAPSTATLLPSRMGRLLGAWRARRTAAEALPAATPQTRDDEKTEQPPVEWALRLMM